MKIFLTNDDGVEARGLKSLIKELIKLGELTVVAPDRERSAVSHSITFFDCLRLKKIRATNKCKLYSSNGTPADCVYLGIKHLMKDHKPDIIISGINRGANLGNDVSYSGTVAAAIEGTMNGIPSFAISLGSYSDKNGNFKVAAKFARKLTELLMEYKLPESTLLNVNVPNLSENKIEGVKITTQGKSTYKTWIEQSIDPRNRTMYWINSEFPTGSIDKNTDYKAIQENKISITPIKLDFTNYEFIKKHGKTWEKLLQNLDQE